MSWFGANRVHSGLYPTYPGVNGDAALLPAPGTKLFGAGAGSIAGGLAHSVRQENRDPRASTGRSALISTLKRSVLLDRLRDHRWGDPSPASQAWHHTARFATERAARMTQAGSCGREAASDQPGVVIIASPSDLLAQLVAMSLLNAHVPVCQLDPAELAAVELEWHSTFVSVNGRPIRGLLWRNLKAGADRSSNCNQVDATTASWLAVASFPSMRAVNAYDPEAWCRGAGSSVWEDRLCECGVPVQPPQERHPTSSRPRSLLVCGSVVSGPDGRAVSAAGEALESCGVRLASVTTLADGRVSSVDPQPDIVDGVQARRAAARISDYLAA